MKKNIFVLLLILIFAYCCYYFFPQKEKIKIAKCKPDLAILVPIIPKHFNTAKTISFNTIFFVDNLFRRLFKITGQMEFIGDLAKKWEVDEKNKEILITIKEKQLFSDSSEITVHDVFSSLKTVISDKSIPRAFFPNIKKITQINKNQISIKYVGWSYLVLQSLSSPFLPIVKKGNFPSQKDRPSWITSNNYQISDWNKNQFVIVRKNGSCSSSIKLLAMENKNLDTKELNVMFSRGSWIPQSTIKSIANSKSSKWEKYLLDSYNNSFLFIATALPLSYRQCLHANTIIDPKLNQELGESRNKSFLPLDMFSRSVANVQNSHKPLKRISRTLITRKGDHFNDAAKNIILLANKCNLNLKHRQLPRSEYITNVVARKFDLALITISVLYNDPMFIFSFFQSKSLFNFSSLKNKEVDQAIEKLIHSETKSDYMESSISLQKTLATQSPAIPLATEKINIYVKKGLEIKKFTTFDIVKWEDIYYAN